MLLNFYYLKYMPLTYFVILSKFHAFAVYIYYTLFHHLLYVHPTSANLYHILLHYHLCYVPLDLDKPFLFPISLHFLNDFLNSSFGFGMNNI